MRNALVLALRMPVHDEPCPVELRAQWAAARLRESPFDVPVVHDGYPLSSDEQRATDEAVKGMSYVTKIEGVEIDLRRVNDAMWAAANMCYAHPGTLEEAGEAAMRAVAAYHGVPYEDLLAAFNDAYRY